MTLEPRTTDDPPDGAAIGPGNQKNSRDRYGVPRIPDSPRTPNRKREKFGKTLDFFRRGGRISFRLHPSQPALPRQGGEGEQLRSITA